MNNSFESISPLDPINASFLGENMFSNTSVTGHFTDMIEDELSKLLDFFLKHLEQFQPH